MISALRSWITALWSWLDRFTRRYTIFQLWHNVACTSNLPSWLYSSPQVYASAFTKLQTQPCHLTYTGTPQRGFSFTCPILYLIWGNYALYHSVEVNSICKSQAWCKFWGVHITVDLESCLVWSVTLCHWVIGAWHSFESLRTDCPMTWHHVQEEQDLYACCWCSQPICYSLRTFY